MKENTKDKENIIEISYEDEMKQSYIDYSMSVILSRAVPDVRDGLKPVQRRIIYDMKKLGLYPDKPHRKSARVVGDTMGRFHPHGDSSIYDAMTVLSRWYGTTEPLVDGQGNFGSIEGDSPAAMRYTEAKLTNYSKDVLLDDLDNDVVDFIPNYDDEELEPEVLPSKLPNLLINGSEGIAVGMATSIPTHNINEVIDTTVYLLSHPNASVEKLLSILNGPDFSTGGIIGNSDELLEMYKTGQGKICVRGKIEYETAKRGQEKLVVTEIPCTMVGGAVGRFLQTSEQLMLDGTLSDVTSISNQSTSDKVRFVFSLKKGADKKYIESILYNKTELEGTLSFNFLAINKNEPILYNLKTMLEDYIQFQYEVYTRKYTNLLNKELKKKEITEGLVKAMDLIDVIYEIVRVSKNSKLAKDVLMTGKLNGIKLKTKSFEKIVKDFNFTKLQADEIMSTKLADLSSLEVNELNKKYNDILKNISLYENILSDEKEMRKIIRKELLSFKKIYGRPRRTELTNEEVKLIKKEKPEVDLICLIDRFAYAKVVPLNLYERYKDIADEENKYIIPLTSKEKIVIFTDVGNAHLIKAKDFPNVKVKDKGQPLDNISNYVSSKERIVGVFTIKDNDDSELLFVSSDGYIKHVSIKEFNLSNRTVIATKLTAGAMLSSVIKYEENDKHIVLGTNDHYYIRFKADEVPSQKRGARGSIGIKLNKKAICNFVELVDAKGDSINIKENVVPVSSIKLTKRGVKGANLNKRLQLSVI